MLDSPSAPDAKTVPGGGLTASAVQCHQAGVWERVGAGACDLLLPACLAGGVAMFYPQPAVMGESTWNGWDRFIDGYNADAGLVVVPLLVFLASGFLWRAAFWLRGQATPGERLLGLHTVNRGGKAPTPGQRWVQLIARLPSLVLFMVGHVWLLADPEKRTLYDRLARVYVTRPSASRVHPELHQGDG